MYIRHKIYLCYRRIYSVHKINTNKLWTNYQECYIHVRILLVKDLYCYGEKGLEWVIIKAQQHSTLTYPAGRAATRAIQGRVTYTSDSYKTVISRPRFIQKIKSTQSMFQAIFINITARVTYT